MCCHRAQKTIFLIQKLLPLNFENAGKVLNRHSKFGSILFWPPSFFYSPVTTYLLSCRTLLCKNSTSAWGSKRSKPTKLGGWVKNPRLRSRPNFVYYQTQSSARPCDPRPKLQVWTIVWRWSDQRSFWSEKSGPWSRDGLIRDHFGLKSLDHGLEPNWV